MMIGPCRSVGIRGSSSAATMPAVVDSEVLEYVQLAGVSDHRRVVLQTDAVEPDVSHDERGRYGK